MSTLFGEGDFFNQGRWAFGYSSWIDGNDSTGAIHGYYDGPRSYVNRNNSSGIFAFHRGGANILLCDGSVQMLSEEVDENVLKALVLPDDGAPIDTKDWQR